MQYFYREVIERLLRTRVMAADMDLLVLCGGETDQTVMRDCGFTSVIISNVHETPPGPGSYPSCQQDAERLTYADSSFDFTIVHNGLHHCQSPHRALIEMYRVARKGVVVFEPYDSFLTRLGVRLNVGQEYEHAAVFFNHGHHGGVGDSAVPNYVYRWTEREIEKTINCYAPYARNEFRYIHTNRIPWGQLRARRNQSLRHMVRLAQPALKLLETCFPKQSNHFVALVLKPDLPRGLQPWLRQDGPAIRPNEQWLADRYHR
jgi:SAM-dependent methyltransferase